MGKVVIDKERLATVTALQWKSDPALRSEFCNDFEIYSTFAAALVSGDVKIQGGLSDREKNLIHMVQSGRSTR